MSQPEVTLVNGRAYSWSSLRFKIDGQPFRGLTEISWGRKVNRTKGYSLGRNQAPTHRSAGQTEFDPLKIKVYSSTARAIESYLAEKSAGGDSLAVSVPITLEIVEPTIPDPILIEFIDAIAQTDTFSISAGPDLMVEEMEFDVMNVLKNGIGIGETDNE